MNHLMYFDLDKISDKESDEFKFLSAIDFLFMHDDMNVTINGLSACELVRSKDPELRQLVIDTVESIKEYYKEDKKETTPTKHLKRTRITKSFLKLSKKSI